MATVFLDNFTGTDTTALTAHTPDTGTSWATGTSATSPVISSANRARTSGTGATDYVLASPASPLADHDYTVSAIVRYIASGGAGGSRIRIHSHAAAGADGYRLHWETDTGNILIDRNGISVGTPATFAPGAGVDHRMSIVTAVSGSDCTVLFYIQRTSDDFYLKSDGTFQAGAITLRAEGTYTDTSPLAAGKGAISFYEYVGNTVGNHMDSFTITTTGGGSASWGGLDARSANRLIYVP